MHGLLTDVRHAVRGLRRAPAFALIATLSLALGIGANAAIFSAISTLLRDPLPVERPDELVVAYWKRAADLDISQIQSGYYIDPDGGAEYRTNFSYPLYRALRDAAADAGLCAFTFLRSLSIGIGDQPSAVANGLLVDDEYFATLRPGIALGRPLTAADNRPDAPLAVVLSHAFWRRAFGGDAAAIGRSIRLNGVPGEIVGVTAAGFDGLSRTGSFPLTDVTIPLSAQPVVYARWSSNGASLFTADDVFWLRVMGRVREQDSSAELTQRLAAAFRSVPSPVNEANGPPASLVLGPGAHGPQVADADTGRLLWMLLGVAGVVLLIACVNLAALMLARGVEREREVAVRRALGSGRLRLVGQSLVEGLVLAAAGTAVGLLLVVWARNALGALLSSALRTSSFGSVAVRIDVDPAVIVVGAALCIGATLLFGLLPALRLIFLDPAEFLKHRAAGQRGPKLTAGRALIALQIAASVPLVVGAALLLRTVTNLNSVELGFNPHGLVLFRLDPGYTRIPAERHTDLYVNLLQRLDEVPGVRYATLIENPLLSGLTSNSRVTVDGEEHNLYRNAVGPRFLETMGMRLIDGRMPDLRDRPGYPNVGAVNETAARQLFGGASPIGRTLAFGERVVMIVGVVSDSRYDRQRAPVRPTLYDAALQRPASGGQPYRAAHRRCRSPSGAGLSAGGRRREPRSADSRDTHAARRDGADHCA